MIWLDGALCEPARARIDPADRGLLLGDGLFETIRVTAGVARHLGRHFARLFDGARVLGIPVPFGERVLGDAVAAVVTAGGHAEAAVRLTLTRGPGARGLGVPAVVRPTLLITAAAYTPPAEPVRLIVARSTRRNEFSPLSRLKTLNYLDGVIARREAVAAGADEAVLLNTRGFVAEAAAASVFVEIGGEWVTPPVEDGALPGIGRALALEEGWAGERSVSEKDLLITDRVRLVTALAKVQARVVNAVYER